jgi:hypothetical protein
MKKIQKQVFWGLFFIIISALLIFIPIKQDIRIYSSNWNISAFLKDAIYVEHFNYPIGTDTMGISINMFATTNFTVFLLNKSEYSNFIQENDFTPIFEKINVTEINSQIQFTLRDDREISILIFTNEPYVELAGEISTQFNEIFLSWALLTMCIGIVFFTYTGILLHKTRTSTNDE